MVAIARAANSSFGWVTIEVSHRPGEAGVDLGYRELTLVIRIGITKSMGIAPHKTRFLQKLPIYNCVV
jgi:hypothetical protein